MSSNEYQEMLAKKAAAKEAMRKKLEITKKEKSQDYKPCCNSVANNTKFGCTMGKLPEPKKGGGWG